MIILGVTGTIGTGKSYFCKVLARNRDVRVLSSDKEVHKLYAEDKELFKEISKHFPSAITEEKIDRLLLGEIVFNDLAKKQQLEDIVYPLLAKRRAKFLKECIKRKTRLVVLEIPLLFENDLDAECDYTLTLYCSPVIQRMRVSKRGMSKEKFDSVVKTQMPIDQKLKYSDFYFNTGRSKNFTARTARKLYLELTRYNNV